MENDHGSSSEDRPQFVPGYPVQQAPAQSGQRAADQGR
eukprot:gene15400-18094_t